MEFLKLYYDNGQLEKFGGVINQEKQGLWTYYYEDGIKRLEITFRDNKHDGAWTEWYEDGEIAEEGEYKNGEYIVINFWTKDGKQLLKDGTGMTIRKFGATEGDVYEQYFNKGVFTGEKKIAGVAYGEFTPDTKNNND
jgi:MORN repeat variant